MGVHIPTQYPGDLVKFGYALNKSARARHRALSKAVRAHGSGRTWHELHAGYIKDMNDEPGNAAVFKADRNWVERTFGRDGS